MPASTNESQADYALAQRLRDSILARATDEAWLQRGRWLTAHCLIGVGAATVLLNVHRGRLSLQDRLPPLTAWDFAVRGSAEAWRNFWLDPPPPGWHDLLALSKRGELQLEGNLQPFMANLQYFKDLLASPRATGCV